MTKTILPLCRCREEETYKYSRETVQEIREEVGGRRNRYDTTNVKRTYIRRLLHKKVAFVGKERITTVDLLRMSSKFRKLLGGDSSEEVECNCLTPG